MTPRSFSQWKARSLVYLIKMRDKVSQDDKLAFESLIIKLEYLRSTWLSGWLRDLYLMSKVVPEVLNVLPEPEEIDTWLNEED
ncbi:MAG: hypothetical protein ACUVUS_07190 [Thermoproteota archaeon]